MCVAQEESFYFSLLIKMLSDEYIRHWTENASKLKKRKQTP